MDKVLGEVHLLALLIWMEFFRGSVEEVIYGEVRLQPLMFQDDVVRLAINVSAARA